MQEDAADADSPPARIDATGASGPPDADTRRSLLMTGARSHGRAVELHVARMAALLAEAGSAHTVAGTASEGDVEPAPADRPWTDLPRLLVSRASVDEVLQRVADLAATAVSGCDAAGVSLLRDGRIETRAVTDPAVEAIDAIQYQLGGPCLDALRNGAPLLLADLPDERWPSLSERLPEHHVRSVLSLPLNSGGGPIGVVNLYSMRPHAFPAAAQDIGRLLAEQAGVGLATLRAYAEQRRAAEMLQRSLLPRALPIVGRLELACRYEAATPDISVGGDWYDLLRLPRGVLGLVVGDVAGHGMEAAAVMGQVRTVLRAYALGGAPPGEVLDRVRHYLTWDDLGLLTTCCYLQLDPGSGEMRWSNAGHPPPLVAGPDQDVRFLVDTLSPPLGVAGIQRPSAEGRATLPIRGRLLLYTDGLIERRGEDIDAGLHRLAMTAAGGPDHLDRWCDHLLAYQLDRQQPRDDIALVAARRR